MLMLTQAFAGKSVTLLDPADAVLNFDLGDPNIAQAVKDFHDSTLTNYTLHADLVGADLSDISVEEFLPI